MKSGWYWMRSKRQPGEFAIGTVEPVAVNFGVVGLIGRRSVRLTEVEDLYEFTPLIPPRAPESPQDEPQQKDPADGLAERVDRLERQVGVLEIVLGGRRG